MAAPQDAGSIYSDVRIRLDKLQQDITSVKTGFDKLGKNIKDSSDKSTKAMTANFKSINLAGTAAIAGVTIAFKQAVATFADTEQSLANVKAVSNATSEEFAILKEAVEEAGTTTRFTASQAADAMFYLSSAGLSATQSVDALSGVLELAGATGSDLAQSAQAVTSTLSQFGLQASQSAEVANIFAAANSNSQATLDKLQNSLRQVGPVAAGLGIGLEETVGSLQALYNAGFQGENAGLALKSALADLANQASPTIGKLDKLGISFADVNPEAVGLTGAIGALEEAGLSTAQVIDIFGKIAGPQMVTLISAGEDALKDYEKAVTGTNEAARQYAVQNDTLAGSMDGLKSAIEGTSNGFIEQLSPIIRTVLDLFAGFLRVVNKLPGLLKGAGAGAGAAAIGFITLSKALALVGVTLTGSLGLIAGVGALVVALSGLAIKMKEVRDIKLQEEFGDMARELGLTGEEVDEFVKKADSLDGVFTSVQVFNRDLSTTRESLKQIALSYGLSERAIVRIGLASKYVTDEQKEQLKAINDQLDIEAEQYKLKDLSIDKEKRIAELKAEQAKIDAEAKAEADKLKKIEEERIERIKTLQGQLSTLDELVSKGAIEEIDALEKKAKLRQEEIDLILAQAIASGTVTDQVLSDIKAQQDSVDSYSARITELEKQKEEAAEAEQKAIEDTEKKNVERVEFEKNITKQLNDLTLDRLYALEKEKKEALDKAEELGADKVAIERLYAIKRQEIEDQIIKDKNKNAEQEKKIFHDTTISYIDTFSNAADTVTDLMSKNAEDTIDAIGDILISLGAQTGNAYIAAAGLALQFTQDFIQTLNKESLTIEEALFAIFVPFGPQIAQARKKNEEKLNQDTINRDAELSRVLLDNRKKALDYEYEEEKKAIDDRLEFELSSIEDTLTEEEELRLKSLGVIEEDTEDTYDRLKEKALEKLESQLEEEVERRAEATDTELSAALEAIDAELTARLESLGELSAEEQAYVDFKTQLSAEADARERAETIQRIADLRAAGEEAEADLLQQKIDNEDILASLKESASAAEEERIASIAKAESEAAAAKQAAREAELAQLQANSQAEINAINSIFSAQQSATEAKAAAEAEYRKQVAQVEYDRAVFEKELSISQAEIDKVSAVASVPWYESGIFGDTDDKVADMYDNIIAQLKNTPLPPVPQLQSGGIVLPQRGGTPAVLAENGAAELALNAGSEGEALLQQFASKVADAGGSGGGSFVLQLFMDGRIVAESSADYYNNGIVKVTLK